MITINGILDAESDNRGWIEYHIITHGTTEDELHWNAHIEEVDKEGDSLNYYHLKDANEHLKGLATSLFAAKLEDDYE